MSEMEFKRKYIGVVEREYQRLGRKRYDPPSIFNNKKYVSVLSAEYKRTDGSSYPPTITMGKKGTSRIYEKSPVLMVGGEGGSIKVPGKPLIISKEDEDAALY